MLDSIFKDVNEFARGVPQFDDITMIVLSVKEWEKNRGVCGTVFKRI